MPEVPKDVMGGALVPKAFFAALLEAQKSTCDCRTVQILKKVAEEFTKEFEV